MLKLKRKINFLHIFAFLALFGAIFILGLELVNAQKCIYGLKIADRKIGGLNLKELQLKINEINGELGEKEIAFAYQKGETRIYAKKKAKNLGIKVNENAAIKSAMTMGRNKNPLKGLREQVLSLFGYYNLPLTLEIDRNQLETWLVKEFDEIENPAVNATLLWDKESEEFLPQPARGGEIISREILYREINQKVGYLKSEEIYLEIEKDFPFVYENELEEARKTAEEILDRGPYGLKFEDREWEIEKDTLISWLDFYPKKETSGNYILGVRLNDKKIEDYLTQLAPNLNKAPVNAVFTQKDNRVIAFALSRDGKELNIKESTQKIIEEISKTNTKIDLVINIIKPEITTESINDLGINSLLAVGTSNFYGSPKNRIHNIGIGAARFNGVLIKPGEEFSFNKTLGPVGPQGGYLAELVIKQTATVPEYGGGLCQVSTTMFRAAILAGLEITERFPHAFPVKYYDPQGFDATIYPPHPDLRFINDTSGHILIQTKVENYFLYFEFYGSDDGRKTEMDGPYQYDKKSDGSMKAKFTQKVTRDGETLREETFFSNYRSPLLYPVIRNPLE